MNNQVALGIDVGTQGVRCVALDSECRLLAQAEHPLTTATPHSGWATQKAVEIWSAFVAAVRDTAEQIPDRDVVALGIDATSSILLATAEGVPLTDVLLWMDVRASEEARIIGSLVGRVESAELPWPKALWLYNKFPDFFRPRNWLLEVSDWITLQLTGQLTRSAASAILKWHAMIPHYLPEWANLFAAIRDSLPERVVGPGEVVGPIRSEVATTLGLSPRCRVVGSIIDAYAGAIGSGALRPGTMALILGSSTCELFHGINFRPVAALWGPFKDVYLCELDVLEAGQPSTGSVVRWIQDTMGQGKNLEALDAAASGIEPGSEGVRVFPAFQGIRSPWPDADARGRIDGLSLHHGVAHVLRATYEGTAYDIRRIIDVVGESHCREIVASGGGTHSRLWLQIIADVCNRPIAVVQGAPVPVGAALLGMVGAGMIDALNHYTVPCPVTHPSSNTARYRFLYEEYCRTFPMRTGRSQ